MRKTGAAEWTSDFALPPDMRNRTVLIQQVRKSELHRHKLRKLRTNRSIWFSVYSLPAKG